MDHELYLEDQHGNPISKYGLEGFKGQKVGIEEKDARPVGNAIPLVITWVYPECTCFAHDFHAIAIRMPAGH